MRYKIIFLLSALIFIGCGIKGPPLSPLPEETIQKQKYESTSTESPSGDEETNQTDEPTKKSKKK